MKRFLLALFLSLVVCLSFFAGKVLAANAIPAPVPVDCSQTKDPEFSSDRPYQASICGDRPITYWCGNNVVINLGTVKVPYCDPDNGQATVCRADIPRQQKIDVDLTDIQLPILGNTQLTKNSSNPTDQIDDSTKVSDYVAWYLSGTNDKAEYGFNDPATLEGISKIVDTSGPVKKLLPSVVQDAARIESINAASKTTTFSTDTENENGATPQTVTSPQNHNQIVVCATHQILGLIGKMVPHECYDGNGSPSKAKAYRLKDWDAHLPPLPWDAKYVNDQKGYLKARCEWTGGSYVTIPFINISFCIDNPLNSNEWSDLYPYVPLANTTDKQGSQMVTNTHLSHPRVPDDAFTCPGGVCYIIIHSPGLKLAHSLEDFQLTNLLKSTYKPSDKTKTGTTVGISGSTIPKDVEDNSVCRIIPSRTNPGDDATFDNHKSHIEVDVQYHVGAIECTTPEYKCITVGKYPFQTTRCSWTADCSSDIYAGVSSVSKTAYADEIWNNTVAGSDSIFRRIYPKTGADAPVSCIADTPAVSKATYTLDGASSPGLELMRVVEPDKSVVKSEDGKVANAQLYFPHYGGVLDYFLTGIQQALRPLGYGEGQPTNGQYCTNLACGELPKNLPKASGSCKMGNPRFNVHQTLRDIISAAGQTYKVPPDLILGIMYGEGAFNPGRYNWTDQNIKNWASCQKIPNCTPNADPINSVVPFYQVYWKKLASEILPDLKKIDPTKTEANPCNLIDVTFALAKDLHDNAGGYGAAGKSCFGITMSSTNPTSCAWQNDQYETSIKEWENGSDPACYTRVGSCGGGNTVPTCSFDPSGDPNCETWDHHSTDTSVNSHNACIWDIATEGGSGNKK